MSRIKEVVISLVNKFFKIASNIFNKISLPITFKVTLWYGVFLVAIFAIILSALFFLSDNITEYTARNILIENVEDAANSRHRIKGFENGVFISLFDSDGKLIEGSLHPDFPTDIKFIGSGIKKIENKDKNFLYYDTNLNNTKINTGWVRGVVSLDTANLISGGALVLLSIIFPIAFIFIIYFGYRIIKKAFVPVEAISNLAMEIGDKYDLSKRIEVHKNKDEIQKMSLAFNHMLDSLEKASNKEKQFTSDVSHELRTPVSVIQAESEYALEYGDSIEETKESLEVISRQSGKMAEMINQLLSLSRMDRAESISKDKFNLSKLIIILIEDQKILIEKNNIILEMDIDKNIYIEGDKLLIQRAIMNLISNAIKFTTNKIEITLNEEDGICKISVIDNGLGIKTEDQLKVWNRFFQTDESRTRSSNSGAGLGLSIVKQIVELHGGKVYLKSEPTKGSTFEIVLPILMDS